MSIPDETLMAYADDELQPEQRAAVEAALAADPRLAERVEQHRALRKKLSAAFDPILQETVPEALVSAVHTPSAGTAPARGATAERGATITDLRRVRAARAAEAKEAAAFARRADMPRRQWTWFEWAAVAASIAIGAVIAHLALNSPDASRIGTRGGQLVAQADLEQALSSQLAADQSADAPVQIGVSFRSKAGDTCRTFSVKEQNALAGLACRDGREWRVQVLANVPPGTNGQGNGGYKPAGGSMPAAVLTAVEQQIEGEAFDATAEAAARARGWQ
jgi:anti-sigma factor RsiW